VTWGREFKTVTNYIQKNTLELLQIIAYQTRQKLLVEKAKSKLPQKDFKVLSITYGF
jgi:hypothetical protein